MSVTKFRIRTFGGLVLQALETPTPMLTAHRKRLALLAILASAGRRSVSRDQLLAYLWPESDLEQGRNALSQLLFGLRQVLGPDSILGTVELRLNLEVVSSDVAEFEDALSSARLADAVERYDGPFLNGFYVRGLGEFERWTDGERRRLASSYADALERLAKSAAGEGDLSTAAGWWRRRAAADPLSGRVAKAYAESLVAVGDRTGALQHLGAHRALVRSELGVDADPEIAAMENDLRLQSVPRVVSAERPPAAVSNERVESNSPAIAYAPSVTGGSSRSPLRRRIAIGVALASVAAVAVFVSANVRHRFEPNSVLVAPLQNETANSDFDPLTRILADWVTSGLARTGRLDVIDSRTVAGLVHDSTGTRRGALALAQHAAAGTLVDGVLYRKGDSLRALMRIVRVSDGTVLASLDPVTAPMNDPNKLLEPLRQRVVGALATLADARLRQWIPTTIAPPSYPAYVEYALGLDAMTERRNDSAATHFMRAAGLDTGFAQSQIMLLELSDLPQVRRIPHANEFIDSLEHADASRRDRFTPYDGAALDAAIAYRHADWRARLDATRRMVAIAPQSAVARFSFAHALIATNHFAEAIDELDHVDANRSWLGHLEYFWLWKIKAHHFNGDFKGALREALRTNARFPTNLGLCLFIADQEAAMGHEREMNAAIVKCAPLLSAQMDSLALFYGVAAELDAHGHATEARRLWQRALSVRLAKNPNAPAPIMRGALGQWTLAYQLMPRGDTISSFGLGQRGVFAAHAGDTVEARHLLARLEERSRLHADSDNDYWRATITAALGDRDGAVSLLEQARAKGMAPVFRLHAEPLFRDLESYPPFRQLTAPLSDRP